MKVITHMDIDLFILKGLLTRKMRPLSWITTEKFTLYPIPFLTYNLLTELRTDGSFDLENGDTR